MNDEKLSEVKLLFKIWLKRLITPAGRVAVRNGGGGRGGGGGGGGAGGGGGGGRGGGGGGLGWKQS